ncbi:MAG: CsgG/HfaB family protein [Armatimonadota bacterium]|nr:CsgG/HfaB family protein [Armatimonadota bacterium]
MNRTGLMVVTCALLIVVIGTGFAGRSAWAAAAPTPSDTNVARSESGAVPAISILTVGVVPFQSRDEQRAREVTDIVTADLSINPGIKLVERSRMDQVLGELGLSKAGVGDADTAQRVGYLAGANVLVWGRLFLIDKQAMLVGRVVGVETGRVFAEQVRGADTQDLLPMVDELASKIGDRIAKERAALVAPDVRDDIQANLNALAEPLKGKSFPKVAVIVEEQHLGGERFDPAAETEIMYWLAHLKIPLVDITSQRLQMRQWAKEYYLTTTFEIPQLIPEDVGVLIVGEAVSEPAGQYGTLYACRYRVEVRVLDRATGDVIAIARRTGAYADSSPVLAGKNAIQKAAAGIAYEIIPRLAGYVPKAAPERPAAAGSGASKEPEVPTPPPTNQPQATAPPPDSQTESAESE